MLLRSSSHPDGRLIQAKRRINSHRLVEHREQLRSTGYKKRGRNRAFNTTPSAIVG